MKKVLSFVFVIALLSSLLAMSSSASSTSWVSVYIDNEQFTGGIEVTDNTTFVGIRKFSTSMYKNAKVTYNSSTKTITVQTDNLYLTATAGANYITANGRYLYTESPIYMKNGVMYAPVLLMAKAFDAKISWRNSNSAFYITRGSGGILSGSKYYDSDEVYWLAKIISAESQGEPLLGKIAVGNVILNRVNSSEFPNTIYGVIFDRKYGIQFSPVANGTIYKDATWESTVAAKICLEGYSVSNKILYFVNPKVSPNSWISRNRVFFRQIGNHAFYI
ncbi:MAG: cell wall hydrolase [Eubacteriales bacterium]